MKHLISKLTLSLLITLFLLPAYAQNTSKKSIGDEVYKEYKAKGIDKAILTYHTIKKKDKGEYNFNEAELNRIGYKIMDEDKKAEDAKKILWLNMQEYPNAVNPNDSYGDVLVRLGEKEEAKKYYQKAIDTYEQRGQFERNVAKSSAAKLAILNNKHKQLSFMEGDWDVDNVYWNSQGEEFKNKEEVSMKYINDLIMVTTFKGNQNDLGIPGPVSVITYNAHTDSYEMGFITPGLEGIDNSKMKLQSNSGGNYVFLEEYEDDNSIILLKHDMKISGNKVKWTTHRSRNGGEFKKISEQDMTKK